MPAEISLGKKCFAFCRTPLWSREGATDLHQILHPVENFQNVEMTLYTQVHLGVEKITYKCGLLNQLWLSLDFMIQTITNSVK